MKRNQFFLNFALDFDISPHRPFYLLRDSMLCCHLFQVSSHSSQATKDSGVGLKYAASTPVRKPWQDGKEYSAPPPASGYWVYSPIRSGLHKSCSNRGKLHQGSCISLACLMTFYWFPEIHKTQSRLLILLCKALCDLVLANDLLSHLPSLSHMSAIPTACHVSHTSMF